MEPFLYLYQASTVAGKNPRNISEDNIISIFPQ